MRTRCFGRRRPARRRTSEQKPPGEEEEGACVIGRGERQRRRRHRRGARQWASRDARWQPQRSNLPHRTEQQPQQARRAALPLRHLRPTAVCPAAPEEPTRSTFTEARRLEGSRLGGGGGCQFVVSPNSHASAPYSLTQARTPCCTLHQKVLSFSSSSSASALSAIYAPASVCVRDATCATQLRPTHAHHRGAQCSAAPRAPPRPPAAHTGHTDIYFMHAAPDTCVLDAPPHGHAPWPHAPMLTPARLHGRRQIRRIPHIPHWAIHLHCHPGNMLAERSGTRHGRGRQLTSSSVTTRST